MLLDKLKRKLYLPGVIAMMLACSCTYEKEELLSPVTNPPNSCTTVPASFNTNVLPLITTKCAIPGCHDATGSGGRVLQTYSEISTAKNRINTRVVIQQSMPPSGPLSPAEINSIRCWIESGGLNN